MKHLSVITCVVTYLLTTHLNASLWHDITHPGSTEKKIDKKTTQTYNKATKGAVQTTKDAAGVIAAKGSQVVDVPTLWSATSNGNLPKVKWLLKGGADPNQQNQGLTALTEALNNGHLSTARVLLQYGANPNLKKNTDDDQTHMTTLEYLVSFPKVRGSSNYPSFPKNILKSICLIIGKTGSDARHHAIKQAYRLALHFKYRAASDKRQFEETVQRPITSPKQDAKDIKTNIRLMNQALKIAYLITQYSPNKRCNRILKTPMSDIARYFDEHSIKNPGYYLD